MSEALYRYYERELLFIRQLAQEFAKQYPNVANRLLLEPDRSTDPHVERLIESFAFLTARIHHKLDDEFPELIEALLGVLYPHYLAPIPSLTIVHFVLDAGRAQLPHGFLIPQHSELHTRPVDDLPLKFRTCYPVRLWPLELTGARLQPPPFPTPVLQTLDQLLPEAKRKILFETRGILRLQLECQAQMEFAELTLDKLRFYLCGDSQVIATLYELLFNHTIQVVFRPLEAGTGQPPLLLRPEHCLGQVGFERDEGLLPYPNQSFLGYRLLTEFFTFPQKFLFLDLGGWPGVCKEGFRDKVEVIFFLNRTLTNLEQGVDRETFRLGCTPVINLFKQTAEPISLTHLRYEYRVVPEVAHPRGMEVYSVDEVASSDPTTGTTSEYQPFYSFRHGRDRENQKAFWHMTRRPSLAENDRGTEVYLNLVDLSFDPRLPAEAVLVVRTTCTNRDLPNQLQHFGDDVGFELEMAAPLAAARCLRNPTPPLRPPLRGEGNWRLISHLCLNHLSLSDPLEGREALQEILRLYDFSDPEAGQQLSAVTRQLIEGILSVSSRRVVRRTGAPTASGFSRGIEVTIEFDEPKYVGVGVFLFACVLERFLGLYASINSFSQLVAKTKQGEGYLKQWPPRTAEHQLL